MDKADELSPPERRESNKRSRESIKTTEATYLASLGPRRIDPVEVLPLEVFGRILELGVDDDNPDFALRPSWVSVKWRAAVLSSSPAWKFFSWASDSEGPLTTRQRRSLLGKMDAWHERSKGNVERCDLGFERIKPCPMKLLRATLAEWTPRLKELRIERHCGHTGYPRALSCIAQSPQDWQIAAGCERLHALTEDVVKLVPAGNKTVRSLRTDMGGFSADGNIGVPEDVLGGLKFWTVDKFTLLNVSTHLTFQGKRMKKLSELEELRVLENYKSDCGFLDCSASRPRGLLPADQWLPANLYRLPKLKVLLGLPLTCMELLECPVLEWLELGKHCSCIPVEEHDPVGFLQRSSVDLAKIQRLVLSRLGNRSSKFLEEMLPRLSRIGHLDVSESITNAMVEMLADPTVSPRLEVLIIRNASGLTGGPVLRLVEGRLKAQRALSGSPAPELCTIRELHLLNCDMLEKPAEDWLKRNVPKLVITHVRQPKAGYRDKMTSR